MNIPHSVLSPLTGGNNVQLLESISVSDLAALYEKIFGVDVRDEFRGVKRIELYRCRESGLRFFYPSVTGSEKFYAALQKFNWYYEDEKREYDFAKKLIKKGDSILEIGCGDGKFGAAVQRHFHGVQSDVSFIGLEFSPEAAERARVKGLTVLNQSIEDFSVSNQESFNVVCAFQVLEHVGNLSTFVAGAISCLKPGGILVLSVPNAASYLAKLTNAALNMPPHHVTWWDDQAFQYLATSNGLELERIEKQRLEDQHLRAYAGVLVASGIENWLGIRRGTLVDRSLRNRFLASVARALAAPLAAGLADESLRPVGHTMTAVLRLRSAPS